MESQEIDDLLQTPGELSYTISDAALMKQALINERAAPELLDHAQDLFLRLQAVVASQEDIIRRLQSQGPEVELMRSLYIQELNRVKYVLRAYLRCRLLKIEKFVMFILDNEAEQQKLLPQELEYAQEYFQLFARHMKSSVLKQLPVEFNRLTEQSTASEGKDMIPRPDLENYVLCQVLEDCGNVELDDQGIEMVDFEKNDLYVVHYRAVREKLRGRDVQLI